MNKRYYYIELYDLYKNILTAKQKEIFDFYYLQDLSMNEISTILNISKSGVSSMVNKTKNKILKYEKKLKLWEKAQGGENV